MSNWSRTLPPLAEERTASAPGPAQLPGDERLEESRVLLKRLAKALQVAGVPAHKLESALDAVAERLGVRAEFVVTPTFIMIAWGTDQGPGAIVRAGNDGTDLWRLRQVHRLLRELVHGRLSVRRASHRLDAIERRRPRLRWWRETLSQAAVSASAAVVLQGGLTELVAAGLLGALGGLLVWASGVVLPLALLVPVLVGLLAGAGTSIAAAYWPLLQVPVTLGVIVSLLPGISLTLAVSELAHRHLLSGGARLVGAAMTLLQLGFGVLLGQQAVSSFGAGLPALPPPQSDGLGAPLMVLALGFSVILFALRSRARWQELGFVLLAAALSVGSSRSAASLLGAELGVCVAAWFIATAGHAFSRRFDLPSALFVMPGVLLLVPGALGFGSLASILDAEMGTGLAQATAMFRVAVGLAVGLLIANATSRPREFF